MEFRVLGPLEVIGAGPGSAPAGAKERTILARLLIDPGRPVATEALLEAAWPGTPSTAAARSLRVRLAALRAFLEPGRPSGTPSAVLVRDGAGYRLAVAPEQVDARRFERLVNEAAGLRPAAALGRYEEALALLRGAPFADVGYADFAQAEIRRLEELRLRAVEGRARALVGLGRHAEALVDLQRLVVDEPLRDEPVRMMALALYRAGRQVDALEALRALARHLREIGLEPGLEAVELERQILVHDPELAPSVAAALQHPSAPAALPGPLARAAEPVGRAMPLARLETAWAEAESGTLRLALVTGEAGIGKTTLAAGVARRAQARGGGVLYGRCDPEALIPYQPWVEALERQLEALSEVERERWRTARGGALTRLLPGLGAEPGLHGVVAERYLAFEAVRALLEDTAAGAPLLLVIDDLHWADQGTLRLLRHVVRMAASVPLLVMACLRERETPPATLADLRREGPPMQVALGGLDEDAVEALLARHAGTSDPELAQRLRRRTAGNPFLLDALLRDRDERGEGAPGPPPAVRDVVARRVERLGPAVEGVLSLAAVVGPEFEVGVLADAGGRQAPELLEALDAAIGAGLVVPAGAPERAVPPGAAERYVPAGAAERYGFAHALVAEALLAALPRARQARLHLQVADALERRGAQPVPARQIALHLRAAGPLVAPERRVAWEVAVAREATTALAHEEAAAHFEQALAALPGAAIAGHDRADLLLGLGRAHDRAGRRERARGAFTDAAGLARERNDARLLGRAALGFGGLAVVIAAPDPAVSALLEEALAAVPHQERGILARLRARLAVELYYADPARAVELSEQAGASARDAGDPAALAAALNARRVALWDPAHAEERLATATEMVRAAEAAGDREAALQGRNWRVVDLLELGRVADAAAEIDAYEALARALGLPHYRWYVPLWRACLATLAGRWSDAAALREEALALGRQADDPNAPLLGRLLREHALVEQRRLTEADHAWIAEMAETSPVGAAWKVSLAAFEAEIGNLDAARRLVTELTRDGCAAILMNANWHAACDLSEAVAGVRDREAAAGLYRLLAPHARLFPVVARAIGSYGSCEYFVGRLAATLGRLDEAESRLRRAVDENDRIGAAPRAALALARLGDVLAARGEHAQARDARARAVARARALDMPALAAEIEQAIAD